MSKRDTAARPPTKPPTPSRPPKVAAEAAFPPTPIGQEPLLPRLAPGTIKAKSPVVVAMVPQAEWDERRRAGERWPDKWQVLYKGTRLLTRPTKGEALASARLCATDRFCEVVVQ